MDNKEIMRQRKIGKQLMLVEIIHQEKDKVQRGGFSFIDRDRLASWAAMTKEEIDDLVDTCASLDPFSLAQEAAKEHAYGGGNKSEHSVFMFLLSTYKRCGSGFLIEDGAWFPDLYDVLAPEIYRMYTEENENYPVDNSFGTAKVFKKIFLFYLNHFVSAVDAALSKGYDWDVIVEMVKTKFSREWYQKLKDYCAANKDEE